MSASPHEREASQGGGASPQVSVVVLTWNRRELLARTLDSILTQTFHALEVIVVDNESTDDTEQAVRDIADPRVRYVRHGNGGNLSVNRNLGIREAAGRWVAFCDDDDLWEPSKLQRQMDAAGQLYPAPSVVGTNAVYFNEQTVYGTLLPRTGDRIVTLRELLSGRNQVVLSSVLFDRQVVIDAGLFDESPDVFTIEDLQMWIRLAAAGRTIHFIDEPLVRYRVHGDMTSHRDSRITIAKEIAMLQGLNRSGVLSDPAEFAYAMRVHRRKMRMAGIKEFAKRVPGIKRFVYARRAARAKSEGL